MSGRFAIEFLPGAAKDYGKLDNSQRLIVNAGLDRLRHRADEVGKPLRGGLAPCRELKFRSDNLRLVYRIRNGVVEVVEGVAIGPRDGGRVFLTAERRLKGL